MDRCVSMLVALVVVELVALVASKPRVGCLTLMCVSRPLNWWLLDGRAFPWTLGPAHGRGVLRLRDCQPFRH